MNQVRLNNRNNVVHYLPHESERHLEVVLTLAGIDPIEIKKGPILCQVYPVIRHFAFNMLQFFFK